MVETSTIIALAAALGVITTGTMAVLQLRNLIIQRKVNVAISLIPSFRPDMGKEFNRIGRALYSFHLTDLDDFIHRFGDPDDPNNEAAPDFAAMANWYESLGLLYYHNYVDRKIFNKLFGQQLIADWDYLKQIIFDMREEKNGPGMWEYFEFMADDMRKRFERIRGNKKWRT